MKELLLELIDFVRYKVENDKITISGLNTFYRFLCRSIRLQATIKDISDFFGQSESNVRNVTTRHVCSKPDRFVYYDFVEVLNVVPRSWLGKRRKCNNKPKTSKQ